MDFIRKVLTIMGFDPEVDGIIGSGYRDQAIKELCEEYIKNLPQKIVRDERLLTFAHDTDNYDLHVERSAMAQELLDWRGVDWHRMKPKEETNE